MTRTVNVFSSKGDVAYNELRDLILTGELPAGSRIAQYELADRLGMSITPIREAVRRLLSEGLVEMIAHRDARVAPINAAEARQLFEVRLALDPAAAELAAQRRTDGDIATIQATAARLLPVTQQWGEDALVAHRQFHRAIYTASHNDMLIHMLDDLWDKSDRYRRLGLALPPGAEPRTVDHQEHHQMVELIIAREASAVADLTRRHIEKSLTAAAIEMLEVTTPATEAFASSR
ncbi:GntR family transcriptional regulator [Aldersonia sp. NBC_00410]|jgi:DNA-binding GntR family transcriptional regulator|uniref:GntR family transcriptional regulator n=1 Tax=Aldersonia sp. NBC_00410 TaxID=2975954 RepID=UPI002259F91E|nr:GntR family transcriptional regulator [Aldersonia sp. NBC_00410]MCX5046405.1 GntR family transcriptional regulator [Aldersonia sp. NBC_00410]